MEFLTKDLRGASNRGCIQGVQLAQGALTLTHALYANDLVIFGEATQREVRHIKIR
jgi:hypothetical protein